MAALLNKQAVSAKAASRASRPAAVARTAVVVRAQAEDLVRFVIARALRCVSPAGGGSCVLRVVVVLRAAWARGAWWCC